MNARSALIALLFVAALPLCGADAQPRALRCYLSIGEAENYRAYWKKEWDARNDGKVDPGAPPWLQNVNPKWKGNYEVKYWNSDWQALMFGSDGAALDKILAQGF